MEGNLFQIFLELWKISSLHKRHDSNNEYAKQPCLKGFILPGACKCLVSWSKRRHFLFQVYRGRPGVGRRCSALKSGSLSFPSSRLPSVLRPGCALLALIAGVTLNASSCGAGCWADPEPPELYTSSALASMRLLGAAVAAALGRGPLPRVPASLGWQGKQVLEPGEARPNQGLRTGLCWSPGLGNSDFFPGTSWQLRKGAVVPQCWKVFRYLHMFSFVSCVSVPWESGQGHRLWLSLFLVYLKEKWLEWRSDQLKN